MSDPLKQTLSALVCGTLFGLGIAVSGMINPAKVLAFLDVLGDWDPSLLLVMGGALSVTFVAYRFILRRPEPVAGETFQLPQKTRIDRSLLLGTAIFGIGWGMVGLCPGPALTSLAYGHPQSLAFLAAMIAGLSLGRRLNK